MHIPENYLSPSTCAVMAVAMAPVWAVAVKKVKTEIPKAKMPLLGVGAAFAFLAMMFNVPLPGGTTGHAVAGTLLAILWGPYAACIAVTIALLVQALLFGDGGILSFGANCFNMAFVLPFVGYAVYKAARGRVKSSAGEYFAAAAGAYVGINAAALCAAIEFGIQPLLFHNAAGQALYCPYTLSVSIPAMMAGHLTLFGLAEVVFTTAVLAFIKKTSPGMLYQGRKTNSPLLFALLAALICLTPLGLLAAGTAWGEWDPSEIADVVANGAALGYTPAGLANGFQFAALWPDYSMGGFPEWLGYALSAAAGAAIVVIFFKCLSAFMKERTDFRKGTNLS